MFVAMMQATDFLDGDDSSDAAKLNRAGVGVQARCLRAGDSASVMRPTKLARREKRSARGIRCPKRRPA
jgi:hypothetical protein